MTLLYLDVPIQGQSILFRDNKTVVDSTTQLHSRLHKRHLMLSYQYVREALASGSYIYAFVKEDANPSDVLSKHWGHQAVWPLLKPIVFDQGDTYDLWCNKKPN